MPSVLSSSHIQVLPAGHSGDGGGLRGASSFGAERLLQPPAMCGTPVGGAHQGGETRCVVWKNQGWEVGLKG